MPSQKSAQTAVSELPTESDLDMVLMVREARLSPTRAGASYLRLLLADRDATVAAVMWEDADPAAVVAKPGAVVRARGQLIVHPRYGRQLTLESVSPVADEDVDWQSLLPGPAIAADELERTLDRLLVSLSDPWLSRLMQELLGPAGTSRERYVRAAAAKYNHHAYPGGLLEHSLQVALAADAVATIHPVLDRDLTISGAILHDLGKLAAYTDEPGRTEMTDAGKLEGEIPMGYRLVSGAIARIDGFPEELARGLLHIILSHHGSLQFGSPVVPSTREATVVHAMDELSGQLGAFDRVQRSIAGDETWSRYEHVLGTSAWFPRGRC